MTGRLLLVNYHYVRDDSYPHGGIYPVTPDVLRQQITRMSERLHMASPADAETFINGTAERSGDMVVLMFDDGLRDHFYVARKILEPLGLRGLFFVCSQPLLEQRALTVQKIHWLRATMPPSEFFSSLVDRVQLSVDKSSHSATALTMYPYDTPGDAHLKYLLNFVLPRDLIEAVTSEMFRALGIDEQGFCRDTYMSALELKELQEAGHIVAAHSHSHVPLGQLDEFALATDVGRNLACLQEILGSRPTWISYPYGSASAVPQDTAVLSNELGLHFGVTMTRGWVVPGQQRMKLNRINCNELDAFLP